MALRLASRRLQGEPEIVLTAVQQAGAALQFAAPALRGDAAFTLACVAANGWALEYVDADLRAQTEWALTAVRQNGLALSVSDWTTRGLEVALAAVAQNWLAFRYVRPRSCNLTIACCKRLVAGGLSGIVVRPNGA